MLVPSQISCPFFSVGLFQASLRSCLNCVHHCDDHSSLELSILPDTSRLSFTKKFFIFSEIERSILRGLDQIKIS